MNLVAQLTSRQAVDQLAYQLVAEDDAEDNGRLHPDDRLTCHVHGRWIHHCVTSPVHINPVTRHRWCRDCRQALVVMIDELAQHATMHCPGCGNGSSTATTRLLAACRSSMTAARRSARISADVNPSAA